MLGSFFPKSWRSGRHGNKCSLVNRIELFSLIKRGAFPAFTDYRHVSIGVPRNRQIAANANKDWYDMCLCGLIRIDLKDYTEYCGRFKMPSLRNVALRKSSFHNGVFHSLEDEVRFYAERDSHPERFYPRDSRGRVQVFDDLPQAMHRNVNTESPCRGQRGGKPALNAAQVRDVVEKYDFQVEAKAMYLNAASKFNCEDGQ